MTSPRRLRDLIVTYRANPSRVYTDSTPITTPARAAAIFLPLIGNQPQEVIAALFLDAKHREIAYREIHRGTLTSCECSPRDIVTPALLVSAYGLILAHNHPSGDPNPSPDDLAMTKAVKAACELVGLELADHLIIGDQRYCSFKETGRL